MKIRILITGGTFDKIYDPLSGQLVFQQTHAQEILKQGRSRVAAEIQTLFLIDSLEMTRAHRETILKACENAPESKIVIIHGTDTLEETARFLKNKIINKTIVLTGAMIPYTIQNSDSAFNLAAALAFAQTLPPGVFAAMNGRFFEADSVTKNRKEGWFESLATSKKEQS